MQILGGSEATEEPNPSPSTSNTTPQQDVITAGSRRVKNAICRTRSMTIKGKSPIKYQLLTMVSGKPST